MIGSGSLKSAHDAVSASRLIRVALAATALGVLFESIEQARAEGADLFARSWSEGKIIDAKRALPITSFYAGSAADAPAQPGALVRAEPTTDFNLPPGVTATRILYHTRTANNQDALASGVVLIPYGKAPAGGWPLLAWSHGTSGVARACAPSLMKSLFYNWEGLYQYVTLGYAVVATDYAGLGTEGRHAYLDMLSNGTDVVHSVPAAHAAVPNLSKKWVVIGHSQGGVSTLGVAQLEGAQRDPNFLGTVTLAGASDLEDGIDAMLGVDQPVLNGLLAFIVFGAKTVYPELELREILTDVALVRYNTFVEDGCSAASGAFTALASNEMLKPGWKENQFIKQFLARDRPGAQPVRGPMLLVTGGADAMFTESAGRKIFQRLCAGGERIQWNVYPSLGHDPVVYGSLRDQVDWIAARFRGELAPNNCVSNRPVERASRGPAHSYVLRSSSRQTVYECSNRQRRLDVLAPLGKERAQPSERLPGPAATPDAEGVPRQALIAAGPHSGALEPSGARPRSARPNQGRRRPLDYLRLPLRIGQPSRAPFSRGLRLFGRRLGNGGGLSPTRPSPLSSESPRPSLRALSSLS